MAQASCLCPSTGWKPVPRLRCSSLVSVHFFGCLFRFLFHFSFRFWCVLILCEGNIIDIDESLFWLSGMIFEDKNHFFEDAVVTDEEIEEGMGILNDALSLADPYSEG